MWRMIPGSFKFLTVEFLLAIRKWIGFYNPLISYSTLNIRLHSSTPLYVLHYLDFHRCELCSWGEEEGSGYVSQTGLWLPVSKFRAGPFCMSKLESTPSICRLLIMLRHHLLSFVSSSRRTVAPTKCWHELSTHKSKEGYTGSSGEDWH